jgi:hypothetical protein
LPIKNKEELKNFKGLPQDVGPPKYPVNLRDSPFNEDLLNETTFSLIHLARQFLLNKYINNRQFFQVINNSAAVTAHRRPSFITDAGNGK